MNNYLHSYNFKFYFSINLLRIKNYSKIIAYTTRKQTQCKTPGKTTTPTSRVKSTTNKIKTIMMRNSSQKKKSNINKRYRFQSWIRRAKS